MVAARVDQRGAIEKGYSTRVAKTWIGMSFGCSSRCQNAVVAARVGQRDAIEYGYSTRVANYLDRHELRVQQQCLGGLEAAGAKAGALAAEGSGSAWQTRCHSCNRQ